MVERHGRRPVRAPVTAAVATASLLALVACGEAPLLEELSPEQTCRRTLFAGPVGVPVELPEAAEAAEAARADAAADAESATSFVVTDRTEAEWQAPRDGAERHQLNAWCAAVGPAVFGGWADPPPTRVDSIAIVSWNVHVGGGDLRGLVRDLREGVFTSGVPVEHFVLLLQEAYREDDSVPAFNPGLPLGSGVSLAPPMGERRDIVADAEDLGLSLFYAPSMRNGEGRGTAPEDRGNAILATLPLADPVAVELPLARQRRVVVSAAVPMGPVGPDGADPVRLQVSSVHLENDASGLTRDEVARLRQAEALIEGLPEAELAVAAGDINTWTRGRDEAAVRVLLEAFPDTPPFPEGHTYQRGFGFVRRYLDYVFYRLPDGGRARTIRIPDPYASDHFPLLGRIVLPPAGS
ncbi:MAG TPA: endonuclease/exonuclease/phosphatase family protein [Longimicrobiales bacterium]|nr:endonuclease/exonuclease/phosphatase family protein [Longimicrobiales bacterium]